MKKIVLFAAIVAAAGLASCTAQAPKANMKSEIDSLSYMMGVTNTQGLMDFASQRMGVDSANIGNFIKGIETGIHMNSKKDKAYQAGIQAVWYPVYLRVQSARHTCSGPLRREGSCR